MMLPAGLMPETVEVLRAGTVTTDGRTERDWANAATIILQGVSIQEHTGGGNMLGRENATTTATLYAHPRANVMLADRVRAHGKVWTVTSDPVDVGVGMRLEHLVADLTLWRG